ERDAGVPRIHAAHHALRRQLGQDRAAHPPAIQLGVRVEPERAQGHRRRCGGLPHEAVVDHPTMRMTMNRLRSITLLVGAVALASCDKNTVQDITAPAPASGVRFFNFGVGAPGVNFFANDTKISAILSATGSESTTGLAYGGASAGGAYWGLNA